MFLIFFFFSKIFRNKQIITCKYFFEKGFEIFERLLRIFKRICRIFQNFSKFFKNI